MLPRPPRPPLFPYTTLFRSTGRGISAEERVLSVTGYTQSCGQVPSAASDYGFIPLHAGRFGVHTEARDSCAGVIRSEEHTSELQSPYDLVCRLLLEKKKKQK